jgi:coatomer subunit beta
VLADGSYATQTAIPGEPAALSVLPPGSAAPNLRAMLLAGDFFLGAVLAATLTKLVLRLRVGGETPARELNRLSAEMMAVVAAAMRLGDSAGAAAHPLDDDARDRMAACLRVLAAGGDASAASTWLGASRAAFEELIADKQRREASEAKKEAAAKVAQPDELIDFRHLKARRGMSRLELESVVEADLAAATGMVERRGGGGGSKPAKVVQLTGLSDALYAEAYVTVHRYDIVLDVTVVNRTAETMQNVSLELATMGDLKLVERPQHHTLAPGAQRSIRANIKVSSTETGAIFGNLVYEGAGGYSDRRVVVLNDIHIDIMDYIAPAHCPDVQFRSMWAEFEWENKVAVNTSFVDPHAFLDHIVACTNMQCLTPASALEGECGFLAANLYARSVFGEDALVNVSVESLPEGKLAGFIRIRSKTQGIALSLGDKLIIKSKG